MTAHANAPIGEAIAWLLRVLEWRAGGTIRQRLGRWAAGPRWFTIPIYFFSAYLLLYLPLAGASALWILAVLVIGTSFVLALGGCLEPRQYILFPAWGALVFVVMPLPGLLLAVLVMTAPEVTIALGCAALRAFFETTLYAGDADHRRGLAIYALSTVLWSLIAVVFGGLGAAIAMILGHAVLYPVYRAGNWLWWYEVTMSAAVAALLRIAPGERDHWLRYLPIHTASPMPKPPLPFYGASLRTISRLDSALADAAIAASFRAGVRVREAEAAILAAQLATLQRSAIGLRAKPARRPARFWGNLSPAHPLAALFTAHDALANESSLEAQRTALLGLREFDIDVALVGISPRLRRRFRHLVAAYEELLTETLVDLAPYRGIS